MWSCRAVFEMRRAAIFDMSNLRIFNKEIKKKKMGYVYTLLCLLSAELSKAFGFVWFCFGIFLTTKLELRMKTSLE